MGKPSSSSDVDLFEAGLMRDIENAFANFAQDLDEFLAGRLPNRYVYGDDVISVYTRKGTHYINGAPIKCLDIGTIVIGEEYRNRGVGMRVINHMHKVNPFRCTYVESLLNAELHDRLERNGWRFVEGSTPPCLFKMTPLTKD